MELSGSYSGADDAVVDIEVTSNTINGAPQPSAPVYAGIGNGSLLACPPIAASTRKSSRSLAWISARRRAARRGRRFRASTCARSWPARLATPYSLRVSQSGLTATATDFATTGDMSAGASEFSGDQFNFGAINLEPEGTVPTAAPRIRFGDDVTVYRHWRVFRDGAYRYHLSPALRRPGAHRHARLCHHGRAHG